MGIISLNTARRLYWLGRYTERVYTGLKQVKPIYDLRLDGREGNYAEYCRCLGIPCDYADISDFCKRYFFDRATTSSLLSSLAYAYDNAVVLRDILTTDTLSYIQLAMNAMDKAAQSDTPAVALQWVLDDILAFRGACEETIFDEEIRSIIKLGISMERVDLYLRLNEETERTRKEFERLFNRLYKTQFIPEKRQLNLLVDSLLDSAKPNATIQEQIVALESLFPNL